MISIKTIPVSDFAQNARILTCLDTGDVMLIDPGFEIDKLLEGLNLAAIKPPIAPAPKMQKCLLIL